MRPEAEYNTLKPSIFLVFYENIQGITHYRLVDIMHKTWGKQTVLIKKSNFRYKFSRLK